MPDLCPDSAALARLTELAREAASAPVSAQVHAEGRRRITAMAQSRKYPRRTVPAVAKFAISMFAAAAAFAVVFWSFLHARPLTYEINGGTRFESGYLSASPDRSAAIYFSDGSTIDVAPGARLRIDSTSKDGARILLERGSAQAQIQHAKASSWQFFAGPFEVHVIGTCFTLTWDPSKEEVDLALDEGAVELKSPVGKGPFVIGKGQRFHASLLTRTVRMVEANANRPSGSAATAESVLPASEGANEAPPSNVSNDIMPAAPQKANVARQDSWQSWVSHGRFQSVVEAAEARGIDACLGECSLGDVRALADAARYTGRFDVAEKSLLAIRLRASASGQRATAAFLLGRNSESRGQANVANSWYDTYLSESPNGEFAADALAGKMRVTVRTQGTAAARPLAMQYLERYPNGVHADTARKIAASN
jgi:hypothetical protein